jgi:hypothetical protein
MVKAPTFRFVGGLMVLVFPLVLMARGGGTDASGWTFLDSEEDDGPPHAWVDMSDAIEVTPGLVTLPFEVNWGDGPHTTASLASDGSLLFAGSELTCPGTGEWSGVATGASSDRVRARILGRYPNRGAVWDWATAQLVLLERRSEAVIHLASSTDGAPIGIQAGPGTGLSLACSDGASLGPRSAWFSLASGRSVSALRSTDDLSEAWWGSRAAEFFGEAVAVGEVNGDDLTDVLVGQPEMGRAYLFLGARTGERSDADDATLVLTGTGTDRLGHAVALADMDGDGQDDLIISAPRTAGGGAVHVFLAASGFAGARTVGDADWTVVPPEVLEGGALGTALAVSDFDGDGLLDIAMGAPEAFVSLGFVGAVFVAFGSEMGPLLTLDVDDAWRGEASGDGAGSSLAVVDTDGPGAHLAVGALGVDGVTVNTGAVYIVDPTTPPGLLVERALWRFEGVNEGDLFGSAIASGSLTDAGSVDLVVGAVGVRDFGARTGAVYVFEAFEFGDPVVDALDASVVITGTEGASAAGAAVALGQLDGDASDELVIGATGGTGVLGGGGLVGVFRALPDEDVGLESADHRLYSADPGGELGAAIAIAPDIQGDGYPDLLVAGPLDTPGLRIGAGAVWVWPFVPAYLDEDGDGFVAQISGGLDCDDLDGEVHPNASEVLGDVIDNDCDGWVDDVVVHRSDADGWRYDLIEILGTSSGTLFDFEDTEEDAEVGDHYASLGMSLSASGAERSKADIWGASPIGALGVRVTADASANDLILSFGAPVDAVGLRILDAEADLRMDAVYGEDLVVDGYHFDATGPDVPGGVFHAFTFASPIDRFRIASATANGWGVDDVEVVFAAGSDRDGDGLSAEDGDCDDFDATVLPGAEEILGDGVDNDCDGVVDGGVADVYLSEGAFVADISIIGVRIDFEAPDLGSSITDQYAHLGVDFSGGLIAQSAAGSSPARDAQAAVTTEDVVMLNFEEHQPALAMWLLDADGEVRLKGRRDGLELYDVTLPVGTEGFVGVSFPYPVDTVMLQHSLSGDDWGLDDITFSALGLDDADGDGFTEREGDCDDDSAIAYPGATEVWYDGIDGDCSGGDDYDADGDGHSTPGGGGADCDDLDETIHPGAEDAWYDGVDADCRGDDDFDADGDGYRSILFGGSDCDDDEVDVHPGADEVFYDDVDDDCDPTTDYDADGDGYASAGFPGAIGLYGTGDCDDATAGTHPDAEETWYDGIDSDCGGDDDFDADGDGHIPLIYGGDDCDDGDEGATPDATVDPCYDGVDADCDGFSDFDCDRDGHDSVDYGGADCADDDPTVFPGDGTTPTWADLDCDGHGSILDGGDDCDDGDASVFPGADEIWYDGRDSDCDGADDYDRDGDGHRPAAWADDGDLVDCNDADASIHPSIPEDLCGHGDEDCDGSIDEDCVAPEDTGDTPTDDVDDTASSTPDGFEEAGDSGTVTDTDTAAPTEGDTGTPEDPEPTDTGTRDPNADWEPPPSGVISSSGGGGAKKGGCGCSNPTTGAAPWWAFGLVVGWRRRRSPIVECYQQGAQQK